MKFKFVSLFLMIIQGEATSQIQDVPVVLGSTLKQGSLCPGEDTATFTCSAVGTDLVWLVDGRTMAYNANAQVGDLRSNALADQISILMRVEIITGRVANRMSVLTITALPSAAEPTTVRCHNGSAHLAKEVRFLRGVTGVFDESTIHILDLNGDRLQVNWTAPDVDLYLQTVDHYMVQLDDGSPLLTKNTSTILFVGEGTNHTITVQAVDNCDQKGLESQLPLTLPLESTLPSMETTTAAADVFMTTEYQSGTIKGTETPLFQLHLVFLAASITPLTL